MAKIDHDAKTVSTVCQTDDEAKVRVALKEILDDNPGYTPILVVEDAQGKEKTYTSLAAPTSRGRRQSPTKDEATEEATEDIVDEKSC